MHQPILFLMIGLPGSGKTTRAKELQVQYKAQRYTPDEHILETYGHDLTRDATDALREPVETQMWEQACAALRSLSNVVVDFGMWSVEERLRFRTEGETCGARVYFVPCTADVDVLWQRISARKESQSGTLKISREEMDAWYEVFVPLTDEENKYAYDD